MMHLYSDLLCIALHPKHFTIMWGVSPQPPPVCSIHLDNVFIISNFGLFKLKKKQQLESSLSYHHASSLIQRASMDRIS